MNQHCVCGRYAHLCLTLCDPTYCSLPGSSVHRIFQARKLEWAAISMFLASPELAGGFFTTEPPGNPQTVSGSVQFSPALCNPTDCSIPGLPVHHQFLELAQARVHQAGDAIQPSHPLLSPSPPAFNLSQR